MGEEKPLTSVRETCSICQFPVEADEDRTRCPHCGLPFHAECWQQNYGCSAYGCPLVNTLKPAGKDGDAATMSPQQAQVMPPPEVFPWDFLLLGASVLGVLMSLFAYGVPSGVLLLVGVIARHFSRRKSVGVVFVLFVLVCLAGIVSGIVALRYLRTNKLGMEPVLVPKGTAWTNKLGMEFVLVPKGTAWLGGGGGIPGDRMVEIPHDFYLGVYAVTQGEWTDLMGDNPSHFSRNGVGKEAVREIPDADLKRFPVENVSWEDAKRFIQKLNARELYPGWIYRLPTEAEWEYACRGGPISKEESAFCFYFDWPTNHLSSTQANVNGAIPAGNAVKGTCLARPTKVGSYRPNRLGLYDMHGNVWQWCEITDGSERVIRGGSWFNHASNCRAADCDRGTPSARTNALGFRLARVPSGK